MTAIKTPKKLIEVALPLDKINEAAAREKSIRHGHPSTLHLWWTRRPLAAARAVIFAQMVNDPGYERHLGRGVNKEKAAIERERLFSILERLMLWENTNNESVLREAREEIWKSWRETCALNKSHPQAAELFNPDKLPAFHDPFAGGGALPLEAQRLGLEAYASDLNPVAVTINKAMIEIPPKFAGKPPVYGSAGVSPAKNWFSRGYLPHFDHPGLIQSITFRLADALPGPVIEKLRQSETDDAKIREKLEAYLDAGHGTCLLRDPENAEIVQNALLHFDGQRYRLLAWVIMPNHVHVLIETKAGYPLPDVTHSWKSFTAKKINQRMGREGELWQREYFDRFIRDDRHLRAVIDYIEQNPAKAGLAKHAADWRFGNAGVQRRSGETPVLPGFEDWSGARGLAEDVRRYGAWMRAEAEKRIGHLYPKIEITAEMAYGSAGVPPALGGRQDGGAPNAERPDLIPLVGQKLTVIAWLWARTVRSPNPVFSHAEVPLASTFVLSSKAGKEAYVDPVVEGDSYRFTVKVGTPPASAQNGTKLSRGANFQCLLSDTPIEPKYIYAEANAGRMGARLMAVVAEGAHGRVYLAPTEEHETIALQAQPKWKPEVAMPENPRWFSPPLYGLKTYGDLFPPRQLVALTTFSDLVQEAIERCRQDALAAWGEGVSPAIQDGQDAHPPKDSRSLKWYRRGDKHPPHYDAPHLTQFVTFRLADTLPQEKLKEWKEDLAERRISDVEYRQQAEDWLDKGMGACWLKDERIAGVVQDALLHFDGSRYTLYGWVIMPNHVHVVFSPHEPHRLAEILHSWKSYTAKKANQILGRSGVFWQDDYFDRFMRDESDLNDTLTYLACNPVVAGLSATPEQYPFAGGRASRPSDVGRHGGNDGRDARPPSALSPADDRSLDEGGVGATAYAQAVGVYLAFVVEKLAESHSSICTWSNSPKNELVVSTFRRQAIPMTWDFGEANPFADSSGSLTKITEAVSKVLPISFPACAGGSSTQSDAQTQVVSTAKVVSTDPPYYDNIGYADLSDFFYVWLRKSLKPIFADLYATLAVPKAEELVATPYRHGGKDQAEAFFLDGMARAIHSLAEQTHPAFPVTIYYAFKQAETKGEAGTSSTGWETFLEAVLRAGFALTGTWPMRTERDARSIGIGTNALASSIVLVCRKRAADAPTISRREFIRELNAVLPEALLDMTRGGVNSPVAPVDLSQAIIGPGMAIFNQYAAVLEADGKPMSVRTALQLINRFFAEDDFDHDTQFCLHWFETQGWAEGKYGEADVLARAKGTSVGGLQEAGVVESGGGKLRLLRWAEYPGSAGILPAKKASGTPALPGIWEALHHLIRALNRIDSEAAGKLLARMPSRAEPIRALAYRLYTLCERKGWAEDARAYNELVTAWSSIESAASEAGIVGSQTELDF
ncbi:MAG: DUF1156 domain-containing protein [Methylococcaceae bacterium]|nr:DUF1156 domain-containing protein [Methylococcaceae bacterium]